MAKVKNINTEELVTTNEKTEEVIPLLEETPQEVTKAPLIRYQNLLRQKVEFQGINRSYSIQPLAIFNVDIIDDATFKLNRNLKRI